MILGLSGLILSLRAFFGPRIDFRPRRTNFLSERVDLRLRRADLGPVKADKGLRGLI